ncbi:Proline iminopeptidase [Planctomycetes bacterium Poly30]|uniref:Proline iminopeptidase n=1 Tax=Saltatorellus ferox TaxID=2528018 RepID=A0A518EXJ3_9BACT|nr:Proline iminopeptidase [Planctomycetes bacterium Poly30]
MSHFKSRFVMASACSIVASTLAGEETGSLPDFSRRDHPLEVDGGTVHAWEVALEVNDSLERVSSPVVLFLHGGTWSGRPDFDLQFEDYSTMESFARKGWDTFAVDARGYGQSTNPEGENWSEAADVVKDLRVVVERICELRSVEEVSLVGWSWGSQVAALFAQEHPELVSRVVLYGTRWQPLEYEYELPDERLRISTLEDAKSDFVEGCFDPKLVDVYARAAIAADPDSPNGVFRDYYANLPLIDPEKLLAPTLVIAGEHEASHSIGDMSALFEALPSTDKQLAVIPGGGHAVHLEKGRYRWRSTVLAFLDESPGR